MKNFKEYLLTERMIEKLWNIFKAKIPDIEHFVPNEKNGKLVFDILNKYVFGNKLDNVEIAVEHFDPNKHKNEKGAVLYRKILFAFLYGESKKFPQNKDVRQRFQRDVFE